MYAPPRPADGIACHRSCQAFTAPPSCPLLNAGAYFFSAKKNHARPALKAQPMGMSSVTLDMATP
ncbi:MAG: hypothetical protein JNK81_16245 [Anaerolineales bacterium]|nr:hypothetical protein [Anaerolineales bacterium]